LRAVTLRKSSTFGTGLPPVGRSFSLGEGQSNHFSYPRVFTNDCSLQKSSSIEQARFSAIQFASLSLVLCHRIVQRWNQTGQKRTGASDIVTHYLFPQPLALWILLGLTYLVVLVRITRTLASYFNISQFLSLFPALLVVAPSIAFKVAFTAADAPELFYFLQGDEVEWIQQAPLILLARVVFTGLAAIFLLLVTINFLSVKPSSKNSQSALLSATHALLSLLLITQSRTANVPLFAFMHIQLAALNSLPLTSSQVTISTLLLAHSSFFVFGNSNAISSIDLSNAYNGVSGYNVLGVGILVFIGNWAGPIWWAVAALTILAKQDSNQHSINIKSKKNPVKQKTQELNDGYDAYISLATLFAAGSLLSVMVACTAMRTHLFIWTVFSPKYLYSLSWTLGFQVLVNLGLNGALWSIK
jgi:ethanolaminephosphotransferase